MIPKTIIDLLEAEDTDLSTDIRPAHIVDIFMPDVKDSELLASKPQMERDLSTRKKLDILDWVSMDSQLRSYGLSNLNDLSLNLVSDNAKTYIARGNSHDTFDFGSDSVPFAVKYNVAIALSYSEAIGILSGLDACEVYASPEVERIFRKYGRHIPPGLNRISFGELPLDMKRDLVWPMVQNLYRALTVRKAAQVFPEGIPGKLAYEALLSKCENGRLASHLSHLDVLKYSDYEVIYFSDLSDLEVKYHVAVYCLNHVGEIKPRQSSPPEPSPQNDKPTPEDREQRAENVKKLEEEYIAAFRRINKGKSLWDKINMGDIFEMGKDIMYAIKEEVKNFAQLNQRIISRLAGRSKVVIEDEELMRILQGQNPDFAFTSQYLAMFFQPSDYYSILGLDSTKMPTEKDVKDAFKRQAKIYHPDKNSSDPNRDEKEKRFKLLMAAKDALLKQLKSGKEAPSSFREDVPLTSYLGSLSKLFGEYASEYDAHHQRGESRAVNNAVDYQDFGQGQNTSQEQSSSGQDIQRPLQDKEEMGMDEDIAQESGGEEEYLGPYFEEMRILRSMIDGWAGKDILIMGSGREPDEFSMPVILSRMGANVSAVDVNYRGPAEYEGCQYYRASADRIHEIFEEEQFDIVISTAMFGVPFTNWAIMTFNLNSFDERLKDRIKELELDVLQKLLILTRRGGIHFHYNRDLNPQSWNFTRDDLNHLGYESAFHPDDLLNSRGIWFLRR